MKLSNIIFVILLTASACKTNNTTENHPSSVTETQEIKKTREDLDWQGSYFGITSCANCDGIETELVLKKGNEYVLSLKPTNTNEEKFIQKGTFRWNGNIIILEGIEIPELASMYKIEENQVKTTVLNRQ